LQRIREQRLLNTRLSKNQVDKLGERLGDAHITDADLQLLDEYRRTFSEAYEFAISTIQERLGLEPTGRPAKTIHSIREKLRRESIRLTQMQDIAGCRLVVPDLAQQDRTVAQLCSVFADTHVVDRRVNPSYGYRAVHVVVRTHGKLVEIQVRTLLQHQWAEVSEKHSDIDPGIKYGGGDPELRELLLKVSKGAFETEALINRLQMATERLPVPGTPGAEFAMREAEELRIDLQRHRDKFAAVLAELSRAENTGDL
jgi:ppGpp synthetase/RelA/SpoT-type nucleotidyltranferase